MRTVPSAIAWMGAPSPGMKSRPSCIRPQRMPKPLLSPTPTAKGHWIAEFWSLVNTDDE